MPDIMPYWQNYIDGAFADGGAGRLNVDNPSTGEKLAEQATADEADVDLAVQAGKRVHESRWLTDMRRVERGRLVKGIGQHLLDNIDEIARFQ